MTLPPVSEFMAKLAANPKIAAEFAAATPGRSRLEAVIACHTLATKTLAEIEANKHKLAVARQKIAALEAARTKNLMLRADLAIAKTKAAQLAKPRPAAASASKTITRAQFNLLTVEGQNRFMRDGGKLTA